MITISERIGTRTKITVKGKTLDDAVRAFKIASNPMQGEANPPSISEAEYAKRLEAGVAEAEAMAKAAECQFIIQRAQPYDGVGWICYSPGVDRENGFGKTPQEALAEYVAGAPFRAWGLEFHDDGTVEAFKG